MSLAVAIQMDPIESINIDADSTFVLALEAQRRGHGLFHYLPSQLSFREGRLLARARPLQVRRERGNHATLGAPQMLDGDYRLRLSIRLRNPYVDPISLLQVDLLRRWRDGGRGDAALLETLVSTVNGIAAGIQNTG